jgi:PAS domain S-box-containing protein
MSVGLALIVVPPLALLALESYVVIGNGPELRHNRELVVQTFDFISAAQTLQRSIQDAERGQRGYLLTGDAAYLAPYTRSVEDIPSLLARLRQFVRDNEELRARVDGIERDMQLKLAELKRTLDAYGAGGQAAALEVIRSNVGLNAMDRIIAAIDGAVAGQNFLLTDQLERAAEDERRAAHFAMLGGGLALISIVIGALAGVLSLKRILSADAAQHESEERLRLLVENVVDYAIFMLDTEGNVTTWNAGAERIKGYRADEIIGRNFSLFYTPEDQAAGRPQRALAIARDGRYIEEGIRVRKNGERFTASVTVNPLRNAQGQLIGFAKITRDISERVAQQVALDKARGELVQAQKMEALGQLSGGIAHDFNNVLHVINNAITLLQRRQPPVEADIARYLDMIRRNADRAAGLTQRLLAFSRRQTLDPHPVDPNALLSGMVDLLRQTLGQAVSIQTALAPDAWVILADTNELETAIINLAVNSRDAMRDRPGGGTLTIATSNVVLDETYTQAHPAVRAGEYVRIDVRDNGEGMTDEVKRKAFDPFFTTKKEGEGTGLGLSQVFGFVSQSGGHVTVESEVGVGTTVSLYLPHLAERE